MNAGKRTLGTVLLGMLIASSPVAAGAAERVQIASFIVPSQTSNIPNTDRAAITLFVDVNDFREGQYVCALSPRVREAVTKAAYAKPLPRRADGHLDVETIHASVTGVVQNIVRPVMPVAVEVVDGTRDVANKALAPSFRAHGCVVRTDLRKKRATPAGH